MMYRLFIAFAFLALVSCKNETKNEQNNEETTITPDVNSPYTADGIDSSKLETMGTLLWTDTVHDFGTIKEGDVVKWQAEYQNVGKGPLIIQDASASCGCTVPDFDKAAIEPGATGEMPITFDSEGKAGHVEKTVLVQTNGYPADYILTIKADIEEK